LKELIDKGVPVVRRLTFKDDDTANLPIVLPDMPLCGQMAAEHFAERALKHVAYVGREPWSDFREVYEHFRDRAAELGCEMHLLQLKTEADSNSSQRDILRDTELTAWLKSLPKPAGILAFNDHFGAHICSLCLQAGVAVPHEISILGIHNNRNECELSVVPLSSIDTALTRRAREVVLLLASLIRGEAPPKEPVIVPPARVVVRNSTDVLAVADPLVAKAMRFILDHLSANLSVTSIAAEMGVNRRKLERAFATHLNRSVSCELRRKRLERCCELLQTTDLSVADIAPMIGFASAEYLYTSFRKAFRTTPQTYRMRKLG
jgi:LacI family transcriptional regulator